jgi:hypothetical protein
MIRTVRVFLFPPHTRSSPSTSGKFLVPTSTHDRLDRLCQRRIWHSYLPVEPPCPRVPSSALIPTVGNHFYAKNISIVIWPYTQTRADMSAAFVGEALPGGKNCSLAAWRLGCRGSADRSNSDSLNRHVLQHSISPTKRTPSACQTCRRRKTKCDSNYPCSTCADGGESCVREPSSRQAFTPVTRSSREGSHRKQKTPINAEELDPTGAWNLTMPSAEDTSPIQVSHMQLDWNPPMNRSASNSIADTRSPLRNMCAEDPLQPLIDPLVAVMSGINTTTSTPSGIPLYYGEPSDIISFPFEAPDFQHSELRDYFGTDQIEIYTSNVPTYNPADFQVSRRYKLLHFRITTNLT